MFIRAPEAHSRSLIKAVSWRMLGSIDTFVLSYLVTGRLVFAASIASAETVTKLILFYGHERIWAAVPWGRADKVLTQEAAAAEPAEPGPAKAPLAQVA
ncbi:MAG TPA: DUF2061 domain-containing protein [Phenylobacterium sp.]|jgi:uncharacterized membrane protein